MLHKCIATLRNSSGHVDEINSSHMVQITMSYLCIATRIAKTRGTNYFAQKMVAYWWYRNNNFEWKSTSRHLLQLQELCLTFLNVNEVLVSLRFSVKSLTSAVIVPTFCPSSDAWMTSYFLGVILKQSNIKSKIDLICIRKKQPFIFIRRQFLNTDKCDYNTLFHVLLLLFPAYYVLEKKRGTDT